MALTSKLQKMLIERAHILRQPVSLALELLPVCNLDCKMCYIRSSMQEVEEKGGLRSAEEWISLAEEMRQSETVFVLLTGGEVFLYPEFRKLYEALYQMGFSLRINTNATLIDEDTVYAANAYMASHVGQAIHRAG